MANTTKFFQRVSVKLSISYIVLVVALVAVGFTGYYAAKVISGNLETLFTRLLPSIDKLIDAIRNGKIEIKRSTS